MVETLKSSIQSKRQNIIWHKIWFLFIKTSFYTGIRQRNRKQWQFHWTIAISCGLMSQVTHLNYPCQSPHSNIPVLSNIPQSPSMPFWSFYHKYIFKKGWRSTPTLPTAVFSNFNKQLRIVKCPKCWNLSLRGGNCVSSPQSEPWGRRHMVPKVIWWVDGEISLMSTAGRGQQCCTGPS